MQDKINYLLPDDPTGQRNLCDNIYTLDINIPHEKDNLIHEFHLKYVVLIKEINNLKDLFKIIKPVDPPADIIKPERIPNYQHYQPYMTRI